MRKSGVPTPHELVGPMVAAAFARLAGEDGLTAEEVYLLVEPVVDVALERAGQEGGRAAALLTVALGFMAEQYSKQPKAAAQ